MSSPSPWGVLELRERNLRSQPPRVTEWHRAAKLQAVALEKLLQDREHEATEREAERVDAYRCVPALSFPPLGVA